MAGAEDVMAAWDREAARMRDVLRTALEDKTPTPEKPEHVCNSALPSHWRSAGPEAITFYGRPCLLMAVRADDAWLIARVLADRCPAVDWILDPDGENHRQRDLQSSYGADASVGDICRYFDEDHRYGWRG